MSNSRPHWATDLLHDLQAYRENQKRSNAEQRAFLEQQNQQHYEAFETALSNFWAHYPIVYHWRAHWRNNMYLPITEHLDEVLRFTAYSLKALPMWKLLVYAVTCDPFSDGIAMDYHIDDNYFVRFAWYLRQTGLAGQFITAEIACLKPGMAYPEREQILRYGGEAQVDSSQLADPANYWVFLAALENLLSIVSQSE